MIKDELKQEYLKKILDYDELTGIFTWKERNIELFNTVRGYNIFNKKFSGKETGSLTKDGYIQIWINYKWYKAHRLAWLYVYGYIPKQGIDHINHDKLDNRISNIRIATDGENAQNKIKALSNNKSTGLLGSSFNKKRNKFRSYITLNYKQKHLGFFDTAIEAHNAYIQAKRQIHEFGTL